MIGRISEVFESIQGEGVFVGERQLFVRFFGCNLSCNFCDTKLSTFKEYASEDLFRELEGFKEPYHSVAFTGGEPLLQKDFLKETLKFTSGRGYKNYLETNGVLFQELKDVIEYVDFVAMDIKLPSSTKQAGVWKAHSKFLENASSKDVFVKSVVCYDTDREDLQKAADLISEVNPYTLVVLQPNSYDDRLQVNAKLEVAKEIFSNKGLTCCIIPQVHKMIGAR